MGGYGGLDSILVVTNLRGIFFFFVCVGLVLFLSLVHTKHRLIIRV